MAAIAVVPPYAQTPGPDQKVAWWILKGVTTGDTFDASSYFKKVTRAVACEITTGGAAIAVTVSISSNNQLTITGTGLSLDDIELLVAGASV